MTACLWADLLLGLGQNEPIPLFVLHALDKSAELCVFVRFFSLPLSLCLCCTICVSSSGFTAWFLAQSVDADSSQQTCWHAPEWAPRFWDFSPVLLSGCWRCRPWFFSIWPCGSETRSSPAPRSVSARVRSGTAQSGKGTFYSETPSPVPAAARW